MPIDKVAYVTEVGVEGTTTPNNIKGRPPGNSDSGALTLAVVPLKEEGEESKKNTNEGTSSVWINTTEERDTSVDPSLCGFAILIRETKLDAAVFGAVTNSITFGGHSLS